MAEEVWEDPNSECILSIYIYYNTIHACMHRLENFMFNTINIHNSNVEVIDRYYTAPGICLLL